MFFSWTEAGHYNPRNGVVIVFLDHSIAVSDL